MDEWKYIDAREFIPDYNQSKSGYLEIFLNRSCEHINGRNNNEVGADLVHQVLIHSYKTPDGELLITRRREQEYSLINHNKVSMVCDELILQSSSEEHIEAFIEELKKEFL